MQPEPATADTLPAMWRAALIRLALAWVGLGALFARDWADMAGQWWNSSTYNHILLIPAILGWLVHQRRAELLQLRPVGWWPPVLVFGLAALLWLLGEFAGVAGARQFAVVVMAMAAAAATLGPEAVAGLRFPLAYMLFLVPLGDELIPLLQTVTARITMVLLGLAHVPAHMDGVFITTPAGYFQVAEACSGVKFLIAMIAYGALVADVCFLSPWRRAAFMAVSVVVPILANGMRAFGTIWIAGWYGIAFASSFDHVFYGWVFFAVVMALCMAAGWRFFDRSVDQPMIDPARIRDSRRVQAALRWQGRAGPVMFAMVALAGVMIGWTMAAGAQAAKVPMGVFLPDIPGWQAEAVDDGNPWNPPATGAAQSFHMRVRNASGMVVDAAFALYAVQDDRHKAGGFGQGAVPLGSAWAWERMGPAFADGRSEVVQAPGPERRLCVTWYRSGPLLTGSNPALRLRVMANHLLLRREATAVLILSASDRLTANPEAAIRAFMASTGPVDRWIDAMARGH